MKTYSLMLVPESGEVRGFRLSRGVVLGGACLLVALIVFGVLGIVGSFKAGKLALQLAQTERALAHAQARYEARLLALREQNDAEQKKLAVYARELGRLQARVARLDALGSQLVDVARLDASTFDFSVAPAFGGPRTESAGAEGIEDRLLRDLARLGGRLEQLDTQLMALDYVLESQRTEAEAKPHAWPTEGGWLSSGYGQRTDPFTGLPAPHHGVDIANRFGAPVLAASRGIVTFAGKMKDFGYMVEIDHGYGYRTRYGHLSAVTVKVGDLVEDNQLIGRIGSTGRSTGPHLHYEVHRFGRHINPLPFLPRG